MKRLLDLDPLTGEATWFVDNQDGTFHLEETQPVDHIIERNKKISNDDDFTKKGKKKGWWKYASIPNVILSKWSREVGGDILQKKYEKEFFKKLNHPDYAYLRTTSGRHGIKG